MDSRKPSLDLEKELTCSICTELLYQPLTLLDCLHTFCGACLKEWFGFQAATAERSPTPPPSPDASVFTCPSCRSAVRDARRNATVATLLDMFLAAQPAKARTAADKAELDKKFRPGDVVLPKLKVREMTAADRRARDEDSRLMDSVREMSLRDATGGAVRSGRDRSANRDSSRARQDGSRRSRAEAWPRQVEHQTSLRSLLGSTELGERDIEREIEELARQIQEEGLLDGLDLDNIDLSRDDELSRRVTEAYRRRQRERSRRGNGGSTSSRPTDRGRRRVSDGSSRSHTEPTASTGNGQQDSRSRPPLANHHSSSLEAHDPNRRERRRTSSGGRRTTTTGPDGQQQSVARSPTDPASRVQQSEAVSLVSPRQAPGERRSSSTPLASGPSRAPAEAPAVMNSNHASFADRAPRWNPGVPADEASGGRSRARPQLFPEPSISCSRCGKAHIEYEVHYNCATCAGGQWNICLDCYRGCKGCLWWFGFGHGAWDKWEQARRHDETLAPRPPHVLTASRYRRPPSSPGGADGRRTLTASDPQARLETGTFCARCAAWTNSCFWRCDVCNDGDWGFCNNCVNQGRSCTHMLLPLAHEPAEAGRPATASVLRGPQASSIMGPFKPLIFRTRCDVCCEAIAPPQLRYHCFSCTSALVADAPAGDYDICAPCYASLVSRGDISADNGHSGWRRCLEGHRMVVIGFVDGKVGQWRYVERDLVGGHGLRCERVDENTETGELEMWSWRGEDGGDQEWQQRLVTKDVASTAPNPATAMDPASTENHLPPDGGTGMRAQAHWAWYPQAAADDELLFPRGAEVREIEDVNGDWFVGTYMGTRGLFPAPYVRRLEQGS